MRRGVAPRHRRLVRRWLRALAGNGYLQWSGNGDGRYWLDPTRPATTVAEGWRAVDESWPEAEQRTELVTYFRTAGAHLRELLTGELDPLALLFPEGRTEIHEVAYNAMFLSRYMNRLLTALATELLRRHGGKSTFRVLEIGSGTGGTSVELIPAIVGQPHVEYVFSDVSAFFLNNARRRFTDYPSIEYRRFDLNEDFRAQGSRRNSVAAVVCANVLHYATNAETAVARIREALQPGGWLLFIEATKDSYQVMCSMEFLFDDGSGDFDDVRGPDEQTFVTR